MLRHSVVAVTLLALAGSAAAQCSSTSDAHAAGPKVIAASFQHADKDIVDTAVAAGSFKTLAAALKAAGLIETLKAKGPFTVFAPTDEAFAKLPKGTLESLLKPENKAKLAAILTYHVVPGTVLAKDVKTGPAVTANGQRVDLVAKGESVMIDGAKVTAADVLATNGVIHVIDSVILPSSDTVVETAVKNGSFKTLAMLLEKADLAAALQGEGPFTVFAPTDEAFSKLPKETLDSLMKPEGRKQLSKILTYHVVQGRVFSGTVAGGWTASTLAGIELSSKVVNGKPTVGGAGIVKTDIDASNGVIHVIDTVMIPQ